MYRVRHIGDPQGAQFGKATQAIRSMAGAIRALPLSDGERAAFEIWYNHRNYRSVAQAIRNGQRYELAVSVGGERQKFVIEPLPPLRHEHPTETPVARASVSARNGAETPHSAPV